MKYSTTIEHGYIFHRVWNGNLLISIRSHPRKIKCQDCEEVKESNVSIR